MANTDADQDNFWKSTESSPNLEEIAPSVSPPPPEVKVRTLRTDLESMAKGGGALPQFEAVRAPNLPYAAKGVAGRVEEKKSNIGTIVVALIALALLGAIVYLGYQLFSKQVQTGTNAVPSPQASPLAAPVLAPPPPPATPPLAEQGFIHHSLFSKPTDQLLTLTMRSNVASASDLQTFNQKLINLLAGAKPTANLFEINVKDAEGKDLDLNEIFSAADAGVLNPQFISAHFNTDATFFVYKDKSGSTALTAGGFWPGYIVLLKPAENWLFLKDGVSQLEKSPKINNFFLASPGGKPGSFKDDAVSGQPVRTLAFTTPDATFVYGWFRGNLILSTSVDGLKEALARL